MNNISDEKMYIERAILLEDIELNGDYSTRKGKFNVMILTPYGSKTDIVETQPVMPKMVKTNIEINTVKFTKTNYITLNIPKYILLNFDDKVPKGTEFLVALVGGSKDVKDIRIIGIY